MSNPTHSIESYNNVPYKIINEETPYFYTEVHGERYGFCLDSIHRDRWEWIAEMVTAQIEHAWKSGYKSGEDYRKNLIKDALGLST